MIPSVFGLTSDEFAEAGRAAFLRARGGAKGSGVAGELYGRLFRRGQWDPGAAGLPPASVSIWDSVCSTSSPLTLVRVYQDEGERTAQKAVFQAGGAFLETVWIPMDATAGGRGTLCLSSQAGCAMACAFCETGRTGLVRQLTAAEIVAQVHEARFGLGWDFTNLVFMGMGEPLHNLGAVVPALKVLTDARGFAFAQDKITVCTVGLVDGIEALAALGMKRLGLSLSLNAGSQAVRERLMPAGVTNDLSALGRALAAYPQRRNFVLALNYCLLPGLNDTDADAQGVAAFAAGLGRTVVNVIPYNPGTAPLTTAPEPEEVDAFVARLRAQGLDARVRGTKGRSIMAACGQLGGRKIS